MPKDVRCVRCQQLLDSKAPDTHREEVNYYHELCWQEVQGIGGSDEGAE